MVMRVLVRMIVSWVLIVIDHFEEILHLTYSQNPIAQRIFPEIFLGQHERRSNIENLGTFTSNEDFQMACRDPEFTDVWFLR